MSTTLPDPASKVNADSQLDDPKLSLLTDLPGIIDKFNELRAALGVLARYNIGGGLATEGQAGGVPDNLLASLGFNTRTDNYGAVAADRGKIIDFTAPDKILTLPTASAVGSGWFCEARNSATAGILSVATVDGGTIVLAPGEGLQIRCNGSEFKVTGRNLKTIGFSARVSGGTVITAGNFVKAEFGTEEFDYGGYYDAATNYRFLPKVPGTYLVSLSLTLSAIQAGRVFAAAIFKNGVNIKQQPIVANVTGEISVAMAPLLMAFNGTTDYVEPYAFNNDTFNQNLNTTDNKSHFSAHRVGS